MKHRGGVLIMTPLGVEILCPCGEKVLYVEDSSRCPGCGRVLTVRVTTAKTFRLEVEEVYDAIPGV